MKLQILMNQKRPSKKRFIRNKSTKKKKNLVLALKTKESKKNFHKNKKELLIDRKRKWAWKEINKACAEGCAYYFKEHQKVKRGRPIKEID